MEELIGVWWQRGADRAAARRRARVGMHWSALERTGPVLLRAFGGDPALRVTTAGAAGASTVRRLLDRLAGAQARPFAATIDAEALCLPALAAEFDAPALNRDLYLWLLALAGAWPRAADPIAGTDWLRANQAATLHVLDRFPGLAARYRRLLEAHLRSRPAPARLHGAQAEAEHAIRRALIDPGTVDVLPHTRLPPAAVPLWLQARASQYAPARSASGGGQGGAPATVPGRREAQRADDPHARDGMLLPPRPEHVLGWAEYLRVNRPTEDDDGDAARIARDMPAIALADRGTGGRAQIRLDLDLPAPAFDDPPIGPGLWFPEWDWRRAALLPRRVRVRPLAARAGARTELPAHLRPAANRLRAQFAALASHRGMRGGEIDGDEPDLDALVRLRAALCAGERLPEPGLYRAARAASRDLACVTLMDLSLSTDAWVSDTQRVIDVAADSLLLLGEALAAAGDAFAFHGFSSLKAGNVRIHGLKEFDEPWGDRARGRIRGLKPGFYTRIGAALRFAAGVLAGRPAALRLLLLVTDGKPNDIDHYEGRYAVEDTAAAVREARRAGLRPFCVTIDRDGADYLPRMFGAHGFAVVRRATDLPRRLTRLYAQLSAR
ncbi:MAG: nitric oxide reductase activation protein NorD [Gammaproteobacteria bacterium]